MRPLEFDVRGIPVPQGSARAFVRGGRAVVVNRSAPLLAWREAIATEARAAISGHPPLDGPVEVLLFFRPSARPASHYRPANARRLVRELRDDAPYWHAGTPDVDKLARSALDALTGVAFGDDRQVAMLTVLTLWPDEGQGPGVHVSVRELQEGRR